MNKLQQTQAELNRRFWEEVFPQVHRGKSPLDMTTDLEIIAGGMQPHERRRIVSGVTENADELAREVDERVETELHDQGYMYFSAPTRFLILFFASVVKHYADVKHERLGQQAIRPLQGFEHYDVENDLHRAAEEVAQYEATMYANEKLFFIAMTEKKFTDAAALLTTIDISRRESSIMLRAEANNWRFELACATGDHAMFMTAWNNTPHVAVIDAGMLSRLLERFLYSGFIQGVGVMLTNEGVRTAQRNGNVEAFANEQAILYLRSVIEEIANGLIVGSCNTVELLRKLVRTSFATTRSFWLGVSPYLRDLSVVWRRFET